MNNNFRDIFADLTTTQDQGIEVNIPTFDPMGDLQTQIMAGYVNMHQSHRQGKREEALGYAYFIGQLIETMTTTPAQRTACRQLLTRYFATVVERVYYIFKRWGVDQIARTTTLNFRMIRDYPNISPFYSDS
ncbi:44970_t:CDS:1 [Gigaspora margarita]|uniref:44970_t:CDS:1 n=1 Tax=Gigaspora margarita TaxID=4874 RepID=A0ABN7UFN0_GIGMA|nr:44970_t:CDS:1 [Gigaspora margarita]